MSKPLVIIPTFNEIENIKTIIQQVMALSIKFHVLVVDDNSPDGTALKVEELQKKFNRLHLLKRINKNGLGTAYIAGFKWALSQDYTHIFEMDADGSHNPNDLLRLYNACLNGTDIAIGSRYKKGINVVNWPLSRIILSYGASWYVRLITGMPITDPTAGFICYKKKVLTEIDLDNITFVGYAFQIEMKFKAYKKGFTLTEVPIIFKDREKGVSKLNSGIITEAIFGVIKMKLKSIFKPSKS